MNNYFVFNQTVQGHLHILKGKPCEDSSVSYTAPGGKYAIIAVADGHGSESCFRSKTGSSIAATAALEALKKFAEYYLVQDETGDYAEAQEFLNSLKSERSKKQLIKQLTDSIVSDWYQAVTDDISQHPVTEEEIQGAEPDYADLYSRGLKQNHIYGTTLIAGLLMKDHLILLQQGDGRCDVLFADAAIDQPIPWDDRCFDVYTTSMCDDDVDKSIRSTIINIREKPVVACFMGSDGVEDSFRTMDGTHNFYRQLSIQIVDDPEKFSEYLKAYLPQFSETGSGDDVSVAGIVDPEQVKELYQNYKNQTEAYRLSENRIQVKAKLDSMSRKHSILQSRLKQAHDDLKSKTEEWVIATARLEELTKEVERLQKQIDDGIEGQVSVTSDDKNISPMFEVLMIIKNQFPSAFTVISDTLKTHQVGTIHSVSFVYEKAKLALQSHQKKLQDLSNELQTLGQTYNSLKTEFEDYNNKYTRLTEELAELDLKIEKLNAP